MCLPAAYCLLVEPVPLQVTIEEREEYEQHIKMGTVVFAGELPQAASVGRYSSTSVCLYVPVCLPN